MKEQNNKYHLNIITYKITILVNFAVPEITVYIIII